MRAGYKKAMDQTLDLCVQKGLNAVFLQVRPDGDAMYPSQYFPWSNLPLENRERIRGMIAGICGAGGASAGLAASCVDQSVPDHGVSEPLFGSVCVKSGDRVGEGRGQFE